MLFLTFLHASIVLTAEDIGKSVVPGSALLIDFIKAVLICTIRERDPKTVLIQFPSVSHLQTVEF